MLNVTKNTACLLVLFTFAGVAHAEESIAYRLSDWKEMHFDDARKAEQHLAAVKQLGCEARMGSHGGHVDVVYRMAKWQSLEVATDKLAHQWEAWLKGSGFETIHGHAVDHGNPHGNHSNAKHSHANHSHAGHNHGPGATETVEYRLQDWKTIHIENPNQSPELIAILKGLGCEVRSETHGGHTDLSIRCPQWTHIEFDSHKSATAWEAWLKQNGFSARHSH